jgi:methylthioribose-1-phosphate isomerase
MQTYHAIQWMDDQTLQLIDQRKLPQEFTHIEYTDYREVAKAIREMVVRGAPAIGITAAYGMALAARQSDATEVADLRAELAQAAEVLRAARPTAVNLGWAVDRVLKRAAAPALTEISAAREAVLAEAHAIYKLEEEANYRIGQHALPLVPEGAKIIHHCNTGPLATGEYGTALRVITAAHEAGKGVHAYVDETRPRLQGARLTAWELKQLGVPHTVIVDGAAAHVMRTHGISAWWAVIASRRTAILPTRSGPMAWPWRRAPTASPSTSSGRPARSILRCPTEMPSRSRSGRRRRSPMSVRVRSRRMGRMSRIPPLT